MPALQSLIAAYRRAGADLPFGDPARAHGVGMEGYYWRFTDVEAGRVVIVLCGICTAGAGRWALVALGDPIAPPLRVYVEDDEPGERPELAAELRHRLRSAFSVTAVPRGTIPVSELKTQTVYRGKDPFE